MKKWHSRNHKKYLLQARLIFVTKHGKKILCGEIAEDVKQFSREICERHGVHISCLETDDDHMHYMLDLPTSISIEKLVMLMKPYTAFHTWKHHDLKKAYWKEKTLWTDGHPVRSIGDASESTLRNTSRTRGDDHEKNAGSGRKA